MNGRPARSVWERVSPWGVTLLALVLAGVLPMAVPAVARPSPPPLPAHPSRIVALGLPADELALALVEPARIAALDRFADDPIASNVVTEARAIPARVPVSAEAIAAVSPDLVLLPAWSSGELETALHRFGIATTRTATPRSLDDVRAQVRSVARVLDASERGEAIVQALDASLDDTRARVAGRAVPTVLVDAGSGWSPGAGTLLAELVDAAGGALLLARRSESGLVPLSLERELSLDPDVLLVDPYRADARARTIGDVTHDALGLDRRLASLRAVRQGRVHTLEARLLLTTTHHVAATADALARALHESSAP